MMLALYDHLSGCDVRLHIITRTARFLGEKPIEHKTYVSIPSTTVFLKYF